MLTVAPAQSQVQTELEQQAQAIAPEIPVYVTHPLVRDGIPVYRYVGVAAHRFRNLRRQVDVLVTNPSPVAINKAIAHVMGGDWVITQYRLATDAPF